MINLLTSIIGLGFTVIILLNRKKTRSHIVLALLIAEMATWSLSSYLFSITTGDYWPLFFNKFMFLGPYLLPSTLLFFAHTFPDEPKISAKKVLFIILPGIIFGSLFWTAVTYVSPDKSVRTFGLIDKISIFYILPYIVLALVTLFQKYRKLGGLFRMQLRYFMFATAITGTIAVTANLILPVFFENSSLTQIGPSSPLLLFISIYIISREYRFLDIGSLLNKALILVINSIFVSCIYFASISLYVKYYGDVLNSRSIITSVFIILFSIVAFQKFDKQVTKFVDQRLSRVTNDFKKLTEQLNQRFNEIVDLSTLIDETTEKIINGLGLNFSQIILFDKDGIQKIATQKSYLEESEINKIAEILNKMKIKDTLLVEELLLVGDLDEKQKEDILYLKKIEITALCPIKGSSENYGYIIIGNKITNDPLTLHDIDFLNSISSTLALSVNRSKLFFELKDFNEKLQEKVKEATVQLRDRNQELQNLYNNLNELYQKEKDLMDIAGHEIRTPVSIVKTNLYMLKSKLEKDYPNTMDDRVQKYFERMLESIEREIAMVNTFLESARIDNKKFELNIETTDFAKLIADAVEDVLEPAQKKGLKLVFTPLTKKLYADLDSVRIREVIDNLLSNAVKYTDRGYVEVKISETPDRVGVSVKDSGIGISKEDQVLLFKKFSRVKTHLGDGANGLVRPGGTGLGLYVAKNIIDGHRGKIWVESEEGKGSTFFFELPKVLPHTHLMSRLQQMVNQKEQAKISLEEEAKPAGNLESALLGKISGTEKNETVTPSKEVQQPQSQPEPVQSKPQPTEETTDSETSTM